jgi:hypothetical protein
MGSERRVIPACCMSQGRDAHRLHINLPLVTRSACICCCSKGGLILYKPTADCECKPDYSTSFVASMILSAVTFVVTLVSGWYWGSHGRVSPFKPAVPPQPDLPEYQMAAFPQYPAASAPPHPHYR